MWVTNFGYHHARFWTEPNSTFTLVILQKGILAFLLVTCNVGNYIRHKFWVWAGKNASMFMFSMTCLACIWIMAHDSHSRMFWSLKFRKANKALLKRRLWDWLFCLLYLVLFFTLGNTIRLSYSDLHWTQQAIFEHKVQFWSKALINGLVSIHEAKMVFMF